MSNRLEVGLVYKFYLKLNIISYNSRFYFFIRNQYLFYEALCVLGQDNKLLIFSDYSALYLARQAVPSYFPSLRLIEIGNAHSEGLIDGPKGQL